MAKDYIRVLIISQLVLDAAIKHKIAYKIKDDWYWQGALLVVNKPVPNG